MTPRQPLLAGANLGAPQARSSAAPRTISEAILAAAAANGSRVALGRHSPADARPITFAELTDRVLALARGFRDLGVGPGDVVAILADNDWRWIATDLALLHLGAVDVPRAADVTPAEIRYILAHSECSIAVVQNAAVRRKVDGVRDSLPALKRIVVMDDDAAAPGSNDVKLSELLAAGRRSAEDPSPGDADRESVATIVYTSGTTGEPKGVVLTHGNFLHNVETVPAVLHVGPEDRFLSLLPSWHSYERILEYFALTRGACTIYSSKRQFKADLATERPTLLGSVPRVWESLLDSIDDALRSRGRLAAAVASAAIAGSRRYRRAVRFLHGHSSAPGRPSGAGARALAAAEATLFAPLHAAADRLVYRAVRRATGGQLRVALSGGGSLPTRVEEFFDAAGIVLLNGYGLTETGPVVSIRTVQRNVLGTIGTPLPHTEVRIADPEGRRDLDRGERGVIWVKGPQVMRGYHRRPDETSRVLTPDGWFNTGDLGYVNDGGLLVITGRAKDTIVLLSGENVEPVPIEEKILESPFVQNVVVVGQDRKSLGALVVPHFERVAERLGLDDPPPEEIASHPGTRDLVASEIRRLVSAEAGFKSFERPAVFRCLPHDFSVDDGTLTMTFKVRRLAVNERFEKLIDEMFRA